MDSSRKPLDVTTSPAGGEGGAAKGGAFAMLRPYLAEEWRALAVAAVSTVAVVVAYLARPFPLAIAVDQIIGSRTGSFELNAGDWKLLLAIAGGVLLIALTQALGSHVADDRLENAGERIVHRLRVAMYARLQRLSLAYHDRQRTGDLVTRVTADVEAVGALFSESLGTLASSAILLAGMLIVSVVIDPVLAATAFAASPALALVAFRLGPRVRPLAQRRRSALKELASLSDESISSMRAVKALGAERFEQERLERKSEEIQTLSQAASRVEGRYSGIIDTLGAVALALVVVVGVVRVAGGAISAGDLIVMYTYARRIDRPLRRLARGAGKASRSLALAESVADVLAAEELVVDGPDTYRGPRARGELELRDASFEYTPGRPAVAGLSLRIPAGEKVALVGPPGAGKSTVAALMARFYDPSSGQVLIDGRDVRECSISWLREQFGLVLQDTMLFTGTIAENIAYGIETPRARIVAAAKEAGAHGFISELPDGYDTQLGPAGGGLSGGQRQRIAIARTLLRDPAILVLDEPTTGLDSESEAQLLARLDGLTRGRTTVIITHLPSLAAIADRAVVLQAGRVVADGPPDEVLAPKSASANAGRSLGNGRPPGAAAVPDDREIPALRAAADEGVEAVMARAGLAGPVGHVIVCKHWPGRRCTFSVQNGSERLMVKAYAQDCGHLAELHEQFERAGLAGGGPPCAPALVAHDPSLFVIVTEWFAGPSAQDLISERSCERSSELAAVWLRATSTAQIELGPEWGPRESLARLERYVARIHEADAALGSRASELLDALGAQQPSDGARVLQHGSFRPSHVLDLGTGPGVIDWDRFRQAPRELDIAMFLAALSRLAVIHPELRAESADAAERFRADVAHLFEEESLAWHRGAALIACACFQTNRRETVPRWREQAGELLDEAKAASEIACA
jgi:ATP-binding cassette subfamily B protein